MSNFFLQKNLKYYFQIQISKIFCFENCMPSCSLHGIESVSLGEKPAYIFRKHRLPLLITQTLSLSNFSDPCFWLNRHGHGD